MNHVLRPAHIDLNAILTQQHPSVDLRVHVYETSTRNFLKALTTYKNRAITTISERRKHQAMEKKRLVERSQAVEVETNQCKMKEIELVARLDQEKEERKDGELSVAAFKRQLASLRDKCTSFDVDIEQYRAVTQNLRREKQKERSILSSHSSYVDPELRVCEQRLACVIEGVEKDQLLVRFSRIDPSDIDREASFVIDLLNHAYKVMTSSPQLPTMAILVNDLNEDHDLYTFIRKVHEGYEVMLKSKRMQL